MIADAEKIQGGADAFEVEIARRYYRLRFKDVKLWLWSLFEEYLDTQVLIAARWSSNSSAAFSLL
ncbi:MAG: hypothetical protein AUG51_12285 [Acidobacteria bacterium 13_1_20CM_3_53_8]|nr:MAG: hypothetical protein AUG51_12285 [Acidobacteria bacterium 13_1_20CM_3_53_8]